MSNFNLKSLEDCIFGYKPDTTNFTSTQRLFIENAQNVVVSIYTFWKNNMDKDNAQLSETYMENIVKYWENLECIKHDFLNGTEVIDWLNLFIELTKTVRTGDSSIFNEAFYNFEIKYDYANPPK